MLAETGPSEVPLEALALFDVGLHVFPIKPASKQAYSSLAKTRTSRLNRDRLAEVCQGQNLAVDMGRLSGNLVVIDADTFEDYGNIARGFEVRGLRPWIRNSVRGGQFWFRVKDGVIANAKWRDEHGFAEVDVLGNNQLSVAPPSLHPDGMTYAWIERPTSEPPTFALAELVTFLPISLYTPRKRTKVQREKRGAWPLVADTVLWERDTTAYGGDNSAAEYAAALSFIQAGWSDDSILAAFQARTPPHFAKKGEKNFCKQILAKARSWAELNPLPQDAPQRPQVPHSDVYAAWANNRAWPGRTGNVDRAVFLALVERLRMEQGVMPVRGSVREVAEIAGVNRNTANTALKRLSKQGRVCIHVPEDGSAHRFDLTVDVDTATSSPAGPAEEVAVIWDSMSLQGRRLTPTVLNNGHPRESHDAWQTKGLGRSSFAVYAALLDNPGLTTGALVKHTGRCRTTVKVALEKLTLHGLVKLTEGTWEALEVTEEVLDRIARHYRTAGRAYRRKAEHQAQRADYVTNLIVMDQDSSSRRQPKEKDTAPEDLVFALDTDSEEIEDQKKQHSEPTPHSSVPNRSDTTEGESLPDKRGFKRPPPIKPTFAEESDFLPHVRRLHSPAPTLGMIST